MDQKEQQKVTELASLKRCMRTEENEDKFRNERSLALYLAPNKTQNIKTALEQQIFPSALKGSIFIFGSILLFEVVGYTIAGKGNV